MKLDAKQLPSDSSTYHAYKRHEQKKLHRTIGHNDPLLRISVL